MLGPPSGAGHRTAKRFKDEASASIGLGSAPDGFAPQGLQHGPEQKVRLELIFALDLFGSFSIKGKGTKNSP